MIRKCLLFFMLITLIPLIAYAQEVYLSYSNTSFADTSHIHHLLKRSKELKNTDADSSVLLAKEALKISKQRLYHYGMSRACILLGNRYVIAEAPDSAIYFLNMALQYASRLKDAERIPIQMDTYLLMGRPYYQKGDYATAAYHYYNTLRAIAVNNIRTPYVIADAYTNISGFWLGLNRFDYAETYLEKCKVIALHTKDSLTLVYYYMNKSIVYEMKGDWEQIFHYNALAEKIADIKNYLQIRQAALCNMGLARLYRGDYDSSISYFNEALSLADDRNASQHNIPSYNGLGYAYYKM